MGVLSKSSSSLTFEIRKRSWTLKLSDLDRAMAALTRVPEHNQAAIMIEN